MEPSSVQPSTVLIATCYRPPATNHLLQTSCYNHLLLLLLLLISREENPSRYRIRTPLRRGGGGGEVRTAFCPSTHYSIYIEDKSNKGRDLDFDEANRHTQLFFQFFLQEHFYFYQPIQLYVVAISLLIFLEYMYR